MGAQFSRFASRVPLYGVMMGGVCLRRGRTRFSLAFFVFATSPRNQFRSKLLPPDARRGTANRKNVLRGVCGEKIEF